MEETRGSPSGSLKKEDDPSARERHAYLSRPDDDVGPIGCVVRFVWLVVSFLFGWGISAQLIVIAWYGWSRTDREGIHVVRMPKHGPWVLSNGDTLPAWLTALHALLTLVCAAVSFILFAIVIEAYLLRRAINSVKAKGKRSG